MSISVKCSQMKKKNKKHIFYLADNTNKFHMYVDEIINKRYST